MSDAPHFPPPSQLNGFGFGSSVRSGAGGVSGSEGPPPSKVGVFGKVSTAAEGDRAAGQATLVPGSSRRRRLGVIVACIVVAVAVVAGVLMIRQGTAAVAQDAPLPAVPDNQAPPNQPATGASGEDPVPVENADTGGGEAGWSDPSRAEPVTEMSVELMEPLSVFVPEAKLYSLARPSESFSQSKYAGMFSIQVPENPHRTVWHSAGGAMGATNADGSPATQGTTFLGSHSGYAGLWGAYIHTAELTGGETIWTKDAQGGVQRWQVDRVRYMGHTKFPQEFWNADGPRRLVLTTCGGTAGADGVYNQNVFVEAKPVQTDGSPWVPAD